MAVTLPSTIAPVRIRWTYAFIDRPHEAFGAACDFWTAATETRLSELRGTHS